MSKLNLKIRLEEEEEFQLKTKSLFRPRLKQIGNGIFEIKTHYMSGGINVAPFNCTPKLSDVRVMLLRHLEADSYLYKKNIVTGLTIGHPSPQEPCLQSLLVLVDSLALAMDFEISPRPSDVQCDILLAICGQPVIVLTLVDGDKDSETVKMYNASVARGVRSTLRKFMDESINTVFGVLRLGDMDTMDTFKTAITTIAMDCALFTTSNSFVTSPSNYEKIVTAFWAGVAETRSVISRDGQVDTDFLRFLTKDQCIILMENINNREVEVQFQPGTGATTLMVEVARRLAKLDNTLLVCRSKEIQKSLRAKGLTVVTAEDLGRNDLSKYTNIVDETGTVTGQFSGKIWKSYTEAEQQSLKHNVKMYEMENANKDKTIHLFNSGDRQDENRLLSREFETMKLLDISSQALLSWKISFEEEKEFQLKTKNLFRPRLKQIGNGIFEVKTHYMSGGINVAPSNCTPKLSDVREIVLRHLEEESFLYKKNIVTGFTIGHHAPQEPCLQSLLVLMDSLALAIDFEISPRPRDVQCDVLLAICGQPVIVLTLVDGDRDSETVKMYNASVARGVRTTLRKFMDESINTVFGVLRLGDMDTVDTFKTAITTLAKDCALFTTSNSFVTSPSNYEQIVIAFWAGVAETKSIISRDGQGDTDYLRFLTKDQCIILMENINKREVEVQFQPGTGATSLMVEIARRLAKMDKTLLLCRSQEKERITALFPNTKTAADLKRCDLLKLTNVVNGTGIPLTQTNGRIWTFTKDPPVVDELQKDVDAFENLVDRTQKLIDLLSSGDKREKMKYLFGQFETLKFLDSIIRCLIFLSSLSNFVAFEYRPVYPYSPGGDKNQKLETRDFVQHVMEHFKHGLRKRMDLFPLLGDVFKQVMFPVPCPITESESQWDATSERPLAYDSKKIEADITVDQDLPLGVWEPVEQRGEMHDTTGTKSPDILLEADASSKVTDPEKIARIPKPMIAENRKDEILKRIDAKENWIEIVDNMSRGGGAGTRITDMAATGITVDQGNPTDGHLDQVVEAGHEHKTTHETTPSIEMADTCHVKDAKTTQLKGRLKELEKEASRQQEEIRDLTDVTDHLVDWEYNMECLSQQMATIGIQDVLTDIIGEDEIPVSGEQPRSASFDGDRLTRRRPKRPCLIYQLRAMEYGAEKQKDLLNIVSSVITDEQRRLSYLLIHLDRLDRGPPMTFNRERVNKKLAVSGDGLELVNWRGRSLDHQTDRFKNYCGTSSRLPIPLPPSPSTLTAATYWETHTRLQVKKDVSWCDLLEMAVCVEGKVDTSVFVSFQYRSSWALFVGDCGKHRCVCTQVRENGRQVGECQTDTMSPTPGTDVTLKYGIALDVGRGRLAFIDVNRGRVLHKFDVNFRESLFPMFSVWPSPDYFHATMRLISGRDVAMTGEKQQLIAQALFCK